LSVFRLKGGDISENGFEGVSHKIETWLSFDATPPQFNPRRFLDDTLKLNQ
jgi:hypothetical protein